MVSFHNRALLYELTHSIILSVLREFSSTFAPRVDTFSRKWKQGSTLHFFTCLLAKVKGFVWFYSSCHLLLAYPRHGISPHWLSESQRLLLFLSTPDMSFLWSRITNTPRSITLSGQDTQLTKSSQASILAFHWIFPWFLAIQYDWN